jgi:hypothetical protein
LKSVVFSFVSNVKAKPHILFRGSLTVAISEIMSALPNFSFCHIPTEQGPMIITESVVPNTMLTNYMLKQIMGPALEPKIIKHQPANFFTGT